MILFEQKKGMCWRKKLSKTKSILKNLEAENEKDIAQKGHFQFKYSEGK